MTCNRAQHASLVEELSPVIRWIAVRTTIGHCPCKSLAQCPVRREMNQVRGKNQLRVKNLKIKVMASQSIIGEKSLAFAKRIANRRSKQEQR